MAMPKEPMFFYAYRIDDDCASLFCQFLSDYLTGSGGKGLEVREVPSKGGFIRKEVRIVETR
jgi:hypothetical protein